VRWVVSIASIAVAIAVFAVGSSKLGGNDNSSSSVHVHVPTIKPFHPFADQPISPQTAKLLTLVDQLDHGHGAPVEKLSGNGFSDHDVWTSLADGFVRNLVELNADGHSVHLTPAGERALARQ
jgi:hypothetical protein